MSPQGGGLLGLAEENSKCVWGRVGRDWLAICADMQEAGSV